MGNNNISHSQENTLQIVVMSVIVGNMITNIVNHQSLLLMNMLIQETERSTSLDSTLLMFNMVITTLELVSINVLIINSRLFLDCFPEPSLIGVFPLQFPTESKPSRSGDKRGETRGLEQTREETRRDVVTGKQRDRRIAPESSEMRQQNSQSQHCQCRNCEMERNYLRKKKRKREERIHWN